MEEQIIDIFFAMSEDLKRRSVYMKQELKCLKCGCPMIIGKKSRAKYTCPSCYKEYLIHGHKGHLIIDGQI